VRVVTYNSPTQNLDRGFPKHWRPSGPVQPQLYQGVNVFQHAYRMPLYDWIVSRMLGTLADLDAGACNSVLSFNYDLVLEEALDRLTIPYTYGLKASGSVGPTQSHWTACRTPLRILKLHGSLNFTRDSAGALRALRSYQEVLDNNLRPFLVPPTWRKQVDTDLSDVWDQAVELISRATRIIILGYSIPVADQHFRYLLAAGLSKNASLSKIIVVNPDKVRMDEVLPRLFRPELRERDTLFHLDRTVVEFFDQGFGKYLVGRSAEPPFIA